MEVVAKKRMVSGIKPTGKLTLGNYIGAIKQFITYQEDYELFVFIAQSIYNCFTPPFYGRNLWRQIMDIGFYSFPLSV